MIIVVVTIVLIVTMIRMVQLVVPVVVIWISVIGSIQNYHLDPIIIPVTLALAIPIKADANEPRRTPFIIS